MKTTLRTAAMVAMVAAAPAFATDVGVSVSIGQPGFYGRLDIGDYPPPPVIYRRPLIVEQVTIERAPIYLRVPPGHAKRWSKHCGKYNACGERVLFVQNNWYQREYVPRYRADHRERGGERGDGRRDERRDDHRGDQRQDHPGNDRGHRGGR